MLYESVLANGNSKQVLRAVVLSSGILQSLGQAKLGLCWLTLPYCIALRMRTVFAASMNSVAALLLFTGQACTSLTRESQGWLDKASNGNHGVHWCRWHTHTAWCVGMCCTEHGAATRAECC